MTGRFIYVLDDDTKDILLKKNYSLIKSDEKKKVYVFENKIVDLTFDMVGITCVYSDVLTF